MSKYRKIGLISLWIALFIIIIDVIFSCLPPVNLPLVNQYFADFHNSYLQWIITNIIWAIFVLLIIDKYIEQINEKREKNEQKEYIERNFELLKTYYKHFQNYLLHMTNPEMKYLKDFTEFKQLQYIYNSWNTNTQDLNTPVLFSFIENQELMLWLVRNMIIQIDFKYFPKISKLCLNYIDNIENDNPFLALKNSLQNFSDSKDDDWKTIPWKHRAKEFIKKLVNNYKWPYSSKEYLQQNQYKNFIFNVIRLYEIINENKKFFKEFKF